MLRMCFIKIIETNYLKISLKSSTKKLLVNQLAESNGKRNCEICGESFNKSLLTIILSVIQWCENQTTRSNCLTCGNSSNKNSDIKYHIQMLQWDKKQMKEELWKLWRIIQQEPSNNHIVSDQCKFQRQF